MTFYIEFENSSIGILPAPQIDSFSFICSIFKMYTGAKVLIKDFARKTINDIRTGMSVNVVFTDNNNKSYTNKMKLLSFEKVPSPQTNFADYLEITLVSALYYDDLTETLVYEGNVSSILEEIVTKKFATTIGKNYKFIITDDTVRRRYQLGEKTQDFMKRILKYGIKSNLPVYLYYDSKGILNLNGISNMSKENPNYVAMSTLADQTLQTPKNGNSFNKINFFDFQIIVNGKTSSSVINSIFSVDNFRSNGDIQRKLQSNSVAYNNNQSKEKLPSKTVFYNWNLSPTDALSISVKNSFEETYNTYMISATFDGINIDELQLGSTIYVILPYDPTATSNSGNKVNLGEGKYIIAQLEYIKAENVSKTIATLIQVAS